MLTREEQIKRAQEARIPKGKKEQKPIGKRSTEYQSEMRQYKKEVEDYLAKEENEMCLILSPVCSKKATCVNHKRRRGKNLRNQSDWEPACVPCNNYLESHHQWAIENGHLVSVHQNKKE